jgi:multidrug efflux pump subunit AcrA (membrane-fusion protein)
MSTRICLALALILAACASQEPPPAEHPRPTRANAQDDFQRRYAESQAAMQAQLNASVAAQQREMAQQQAAYAQQQAQQQAGYAQMFDEAVRERDEQQAAKAAAHKAHCESSRPRRLAAAQDAISKHVAMLTAVARRQDEITSRCSYEDTRGVHVERQRTSSGVIFRTREVGDPSELKCRGGIPKGLKREHVDFVLTYGEIAETEVWRLAENSNDCIAHDRAAGFNTEATLADLEALRAILALEL